MMTAEQFYDEWIKKPDADAGNRRSFFRFAEAYAAAQLAEKEREIARLHKLFCDLTPGGSEFAGDPNYCAKYLRDRANTQTDLLKKKFIELRQREAELERLRARLRAAADEAETWIEHGIKGGGIDWRTGLEVLTEKCRNWASPPKVQP